MSQGTSDSTKRSMSPSKKGHPEAARARFEAAWKSAESAQSRPHIRDYLLELPEPERSEVFCSLLAVELQLRKQMGEDPSPDDYIKLFPESANQIQSIFHETGARHPAQTSSLQGEAPKTKNNVRSSLDTPTVSFFPNRETDSTQALNGEAHALAGQPPSTEWLGRKKRRSAKPIPLPTVPGYEVLEEVGRGGMGIVYKARDLQLDCLVALKMIHPKRSQSSSRRDMEHLLAEARAVARCRHPNLVHIYKIDEHDGHPYLSLEFLDGGNLSHKLAGMPQPANEAAALLETLARAMEFAHKKNIVHRDLKPSNILLSEDGTLKITDFGLAKKLDEGADQTEEGWIVGTTMYMAAEQAWGKNTEVGSAADIYSLGAILYEMLTGRPPFKAADKWETLRLVRTADPVPPRSLVPQVPYELELICLKCLKKDPRQRYASAGQLADELRNFQEGRPLVHTRPTPRWEMLWKWSKRQPALASLLVVGFLALVSVMLLLYQEVRQQQHLGERRDRVRVLHLQAQEASDHGKLDEAHSHLKAAFEIIGSEPGLEELKPDLAALETAIARQDQVRRGKQDAGEKYQHLFKHRDAALFHGMVFTGVDLPANVEATKKACREALALFPTDAAGRPIFPEYLSAEEKQRGVAACYELLLVWAEAEAPPAHDGADPAPASIKEGLKRLDQAAGLGQPPTRAYHLRRARFLKLQHQDDEADKERQLAADTKPAGALDYFLTADSLLKQGRLKEAAHGFAAAVRSEPDHYWAWYFLGMCNLQLQRPDLAEKNFTGCLSIRKDILWPYVMRGFANIELKHFDDADLDFQQALTMKPDAQALYGIKVLQGVLCLRQAKLVDAWIPLPWLDPFTPNLDLACRGPAEAWRENKLVAATAFLEDARKLQEERYPAHLYLALVCQQQNKLDEAVTRIDQAIVITDKKNLLVQAHLYGQRARLYRQQHKLDDASRDLTKALELFPTAEDYAERGRILYALKKLKAAVADFDEALRRRPEEAGVYLWKANTLLAMRKESDVRKEKDLRIESDALTALQQYVAKNGPRSAEVFRTIGRLHALRRQVPESIVAFGEALKLEATSATFAARGWAYLASEDVDRALFDFEEAIRRDPANAVAYAGRGLIRTRQDRHADANADADLALKRGGETPSFLLLWNVAHVYAQIAAAAGTRNQRREYYHYQNRAVDTLDKAFQQVPEDRKAGVWQEYVANDALFFSLHSSTDYVSLEKRLRSK